MELEPALGRSGNSGLLGQLSGHPFAGFAFAKAFADAVPVEVPAWNTYMLAREIPGTRRYDVAGCYPFVPFSPEVDLERGIAQLKQRGFVSLTFVTDPLHMPDAARLDQVFDLCRPFKTHYIFDRRLGPPIKSHARWRRVEIARGALHITEVPYSPHVATWARLYGNLATHHGLTGALVFDDAFFARLRSVPGLRAIAGFCNGEIISAMLFVAHGDTAYSFLAGTSPEGRRLCAHYGLYAEAIEGFTDVTFVNLGGAPGLVDDPHHGVAHVKQKLTNIVRRSYLCGSILDHDAYFDLAGKADFFPAYRAPGGAKQEHGV